MWADINVLDLLSYGVEWKPNVADPALTRVGNMDYHKTLPIQSEMKGCILNPKTKKVVYWLDKSDWNYKKERYTAKKLSVAENNDTGNMLVTLQLTAEIVKSFENSSTIKVIHPEISRPYEHRIVSRTENTITYDDDTIDGGVNSSYTIFVAARLDGYDGEVFVYVPEFWIKSWDEPDRRCVRISPTKIDDSWEHQPAIFVGAYKDTVLNTVPENMGYLSTLEVNSAISVANSSTYCRGGKNNPKNDTNEDIFKRDLGKPILGNGNTLNREYFRGHVRKTGKEIMSYKQYKNIMYWLYIIEYANFNSQAEFNPELTIEGFHQGGLGNGITGISESINFTYGEIICPNGYTNNFGNGTGIKLIESRDLELNNLYAIRWRGLENTFGDAPISVDGIIIVVDVNNPDWPFPEYVYITDDPAKYGDSISDITNMTLVTTWIGDGCLTIKEFELGSTAAIVAKEFINASNQYKCDALYTMYDSETTNVKFGGISHFSNSMSGLACMINIPDYSYSYAYRTVVVI